MHELAISLGGMTVSELRKRMTVGELLRWRAYRDKHGPLCRNFRNDLAIGRMAMRMAGGKASDYMPWPKEPEPKPAGPVTAEQFYNHIKAIAAKNTGSK